jgi:hypothetical protein
MGTAGREALADAVAPSSAQSTALDQTTTASFALWPFAQLARRNQMPIEQFCKLAGVQVPSLRDPDVRFSQAVANRVAELAYTHFGPQAAMAAALTVEAGQFNLLELLARTAPTVAGGLQQGCRFFPLVHDGGRLTHEIAENGTHALRWRPPAGYDVHHGYVELTFGVALRGLRRETGKELLAPTVVWFTHPAPADTSLHAQVLCEAVRFEMPYDQMVFDDHTAALPLTRKNTAVHAAATEIATDLLAE